MPNSREAIVSFAALAMGGYVMVPIVHIYGRKEVAFILGECGADAYIAPAGYGHVDYTSIIDESAPAGLRVHVVVGDGADQPAPEGVRRVGWSHSNRSTRWSSCRCRPPTRSPCSPTHRARRATRRV